MTKRLTSIQRGLLFLLARWSGPAVVAYKFSSGFLQERGASEHLVCNDVDSEPMIHDVPEFSGKIHGWGEAAVVRDGRVVFSPPWAKTRAGFRSIAMSCFELLPPKSDAVSSSVAGVRERAVRCTAAAEAVAELGRSP